MLMGSRSCNSFPSPPPKPGRPESGQGRWFVFVVLCLFVGLFVLSFVCLFVCSLFLFIYLVVVCVVVYAFAF